VLTYARRRYDTYSAVGVQKKQRILDTNALQPASHKVTRGIIIRNKRLKKLLRGAVALMVQWLHVSRRAALLGTLL
jgi:hypothetical protein